MPLTTQQREIIEADLKPYGYSLSDSDELIGSDDTGTGIGVSVKRSRLQLRTLVSSSLLFSGPVSTGASQFVQEFWFARPIDEQ